MAEPGGASGVSASPTVVAELRATVSATRQLFGAAACSCALVDEDGERLTFVAADGVGADAIVGLSIPVSRGIAGWAAMSGQPITVTEVEKDARFARDVAESTQFVPNTIMAAPLMSVDGEVSGVIEVLDPDRAEEESRLGPRRGTAAELTALTVVAMQAAGVVRLGQRLEAAEASPAFEDVSGQEMEAVAGAVRAITASGPAGAQLARQVLTAVADFLRSGP